MAEWSKAMRLGRIPKGRGFKSHSRHFGAETMFLDCRLEISCSARRKLIYMLRWQSHVQTLWHTLLLLVQHLLPCLHPRTPVCQPTMDDTDANNAKT